MNKTYLMMGMAFTLCCAACSDDDNNEAPGTQDNDEVVEEPIVQGFWQQPAATMLGYQSHPTACTERTEVQLDGVWEEYTCCVTRFNAQGAVTYYNPTGQEPQKRMLGMEENYYTYAYDDAGRLVAATEHSLGDAEVSYTLSYGEGNRHVPLPFAVAGIRPYLVRGLQGVSVTGLPLTATFTDTEVRYETVQQAFRTTLHTVLTYVYNTSSDCYPIGCTLVQYTDEDGELSREVTHYGFDLDNGGLIEQTDVDAEGNTTGIHYRNGNPLQPTLKDMYDASGHFLASMKYEYTEDGLLATQSYEGDGIPGSIEYYGYEGVDSHGNWTVANCQWSDKVNSNHFTAPARITRTLEY